MFGELPFKLPIFVSHVNRTHKVFAKQTKAARWVFNLGFMVVLPTE